MSPPKPPSGPLNDPFTDPLSGSGTEKLSAGDNFTPLSSQMTNQNADIGIGKPPPDASYYDYNDGGSNLPIILMGIGAVLITAMIAGLVYLAYMKGLEDGQSSMPPLILAEEAPVKTPPPEEITARRPEEGELNIYGQLGVEDVDASTQENITAEALSESVEDISAIKEDSIEGDGGIESLMAEVMDVETQIFDNAASENPEAMVDETLEETSIEESQSEENLIPLASPKSENKSEITSEIVSEVSTNIAPLVTENNYMVQLISVKTPVEASKEFIRISNKNKSIIGNREPFVKEVDLGERGKFYRVNIPGFVSLDAANEFCNALKENGQDCLVVKVPQ